MNITVVIPSLEEDMRDLGLSPLEERQVVGSYSLTEHLDEMKGCSCKGKTTKCKNCMAMEYDDDFDGDEDEDELDEGFKIRRKARGAGARRASRLAKKKRKPGRAKAARASRQYRSSGAGKRSGKKYDLAVKKTGGAKGQARRRKDGKRLVVSDVEGRFATLMDDVSSLLADGNEEVLAEAVAGFENIREIATLLSEAFNFFGTQDRNREYLVLAEALDTLSQRADAYVDELEDEDIDPEDPSVIEDFHLQTHIILNASELYENVVEGEEASDYDEDDDFDVDDFDEDFDDDDDFDVDYLDEDDDDFDEDDFDEDADYEDDDDFDADDFDDDEDLDEGEF